jgi:glycosyltransferase involved in cell wall biosynthesis
MTFARGMAGASVPSRMYNQMAAGRPILASADRHSELALVVREEEIGWVVPPEDPERLVAAILEARRDPERLRAMGERARRTAEQTYTFMRSLELLTEVIQPQTVVAAAA